MNKKNKKDKSKAKARNDAPDYDAHLHLLQIAMRRHLPWPEASTP